MNERREAIVAAVVELISETRTSEVIMSDVVERSGAALKTIYRHFGSKDRLLAEALRSWHRHVLEVTTAAPVAAGTGPRVVQYLERSLAAFSDDPGMTMLLVRYLSASDPSVAEVLSGMYVDAAEMLGDFFGGDETASTLAHALKTYGATAFALKRAPRPVIIAEILDAARAAFGLRE